LHFKGLQSSLVDTAIVQTLSSCAIGEKIVIALQAYAHTCKPAMRISGIPLTRSAISPPALRHCTAPHNAMQCRASARVRHSLRSWLSCFLRVASCSSFGALCSSCPRARRLRALGTLRQVCPLAGSFLTSSHLPTLFRSTAPFCNARPA
jgi:hypothetical protein